MAGLWPNSQIAIWAAREMQQRPAGVETDFLFIGTDKIHHQVLLTIQELRDMVFWAVTRKWTFCRATSPSCEFHTHRIDILQRGKWRPSTSQWWYGHRTDDGCQMHCCLQGQLILYGWFRILARML